VAVDLEQNGASFDELLMRPGLRWDENIAAVLSFICMYMHLRMYGTTGCQSWVRFIQVAPSLAREPPSPWAVCNA
jgi:hypothetical protein